MSLKKYDLPNLSKNYVYESQIQKLNTIKSSLLALINQKSRSKTIQGNYRSKANIIYKQKIRKVFHPLKMQQRQDMLNFQGYFDQYIKRQDTIKQLPQDNQPYTNQSIRQMNKKDVFQTILTLDHKQISKLEKLKSKRQQFVTQLDFSNQVQRKNMKLPRILKENRKNNMNRKQRLDQNSPLFKYDQSKFSLNSPLKRNMSKNSNSIQTEKSRSSSLKKSKSPKLRRKASNLQNFYTPSKLIQKLNHFSDSKHQINNFQISFQKLNQVFQKRYGTPKIVPYFELPPVLNINQIVDMLSQFSKASYQQKMMLFFLIFDFNSDGFICQDDLFRISQKIDFNSPILNDLYYISKYCKQHDNVVSTKSMIPLEFLEDQTRKNYLKIFEPPTEPVKKQPSLAPSKASQSHRYFTINGLQTQRNKLTYKEEQINVNKRFRINFNLFLKIFQNQNCQFIEDFLLFLVSQPKQPPSPKKIKRKFTLEAISYRSKSLELRSSNRSIENSLQRLNTDNSIQSYTNKFTTLPTQIHQNSSKINYKNNMKKHKNSVYDPQSWRTDQNIKSQLSPVQKEALEKQQNLLKMLQNPRLYIMKIKQSNKQIQRKLKTLGVD